MSQVFALASICLLTVAALDSIALAFLLGGSLAAYYVELRQLKAAIEGIEAMIQGAPDSKKP